MKNKAAIYKIRSVLFPDRIYVGSAQAFHKRVHTHMKQLRRNQHDNRKLQNHYNKYGESDLEFVILEVVQDRTKLIEREQFYIDSLQPYFNIRKIAESNLGLKHSDEAKAKISAWNSQRKHSEETKKKISEVQKGKFIPLETREKMREAKLGKKRGSYKTKKNENQVLLETSNREDNSFKSS